LKRPDRKIMHAFKSILSEIRQSSSKPRNKKNKENDWLKNCTLQIWDLREFKVPWERVADIILGEDDEGGTEKVKGAHKVSKECIDKGEWIYLVGHVETE
jgi:hypothetical protein